ncbi:hypothetical protein Clacol_007907 [Clathrus columnatus]|uniref:BTB domain-containing protein n=1 Tax=Clathrus columnatus TaxID=1419009 RepID=A0AAV5AG83_9AGAM|nr:hypothetical protein Clacol_007907 [Clathrus columnatus]
MASLESTNVDATPVTIRNSKSIYLSDGDIVLFSLPKTNVVTAFKVDCVFLRRSSPVFEGMFMLPPSEDAESYDNVPLVKLQDEADHLTMFLKALYDPRYIPREKHNINTIRAVEGILLLANKYQVDHLRELIVGLLEQDWPTKLSHWDLNEMEIRAKKGLSEFINESSIPDPCEVIRLARKCDVSSILPAAFYHLSRIRGISYRHLPESLQETFSYEDREETSDFSLLSVEDFCCLLVGRDAMLRIFKSYLDTALLSAMNSNRCTSDPDECSRVCTVYGTICNKPYSNITMIPCL